MTVARDDADARGQQAADPSPVLAGRLEPGTGSGPVLVIGDRRIPWALVGEVLAGAGCVDLALVVSPVSVSGEARPVITSIHGPAAPERPVRLTAVPDAPAPPDEPVVLTPFQPRPPLRAAVDSIEAEAWSEAVTLLRERLPKRVPCPVAEMEAVCADVRAQAARRAALWDLVGDAAGWDAQPPDDDVDLWTGAAMALISVAVDGMDEEAARCLDAMELDDWLSTILELVRSGPGTPADPENLLALSARCLDVDTAAVDPSLAPMMATAFRALAPVWYALGAVDASWSLTRLGAWGLPLAAARAWGGWLDS
jgi:hypothetical protein